MSQIDGIKAGMEVIGADGVHVGKVERVVNARIKLVPEGSGEGGHRGHEGHHHYIAAGLIAEVEGTKVRLSANANVAVTFEEESDGKTRL